MVFGSIPIPSHLQPPLLISSFFVLVGIAICKQAPKRQRKTVSKLQPLETLQHTADFPEPGQELRTKAAPRGTWNLLRTQRERSGQAAEEGVTRRRVTAARGKGIGDLGERTEE